MKSIRIFRVAVWTLGVLLTAPLCEARGLPGQAPIAQADTYSTVTGDNLSVDAPGVLTNDMDPEGDPLTAILVDSSGASGLLILSPDGSLEYEVAAGFIGTDTFTYVANDGTQNSAPATVTFTVTTGGVGTPIGLTNRATFLSLIEAQGWMRIDESFEDPLWPRTPVTATSVSNLGVTWTANNPVSGITTGTGPAILGQYGFYQLPHGDYATGTNCNTPGNCTDGWIATAEDGKFVAAGLWIHCNAGTAGIEFILDGDTLNPVDFGGVKLPAGSTGFFGVVAGAGFRTLEIHETEGKAEDASYIFADVFSFATGPAAVVTPYGCGVNPDDSLTIVAGAPELGSTFTLGLDNPLGTQAIGSRAYISIAIDPAVGFPCGPLLANAGMSAPGAPGEFLLSVTPPNPIYKRLGPAWKGPGQPAKIKLTVPDDPTLVGVTIYVQGALLDIVPGAGIPVGLTNALSIQIGL